MPNVKKWAKKQGFTLVELVVAVIILGILVLIAIPVYNNVTANAKRRAVETNLRIIDGAVSVYQAGEGSPPADVEAGSSINTLAGYLESLPEGPDNAVYGIKNGKAVVNIPAKPWAGSLAGKNSLKLSDLNW